MGKTLEVEDSPGMVWLVGMAISVIVKHVLIDNLRLQF